MSGRVHANPEDLKQLRGAVDRSQRDIKEAVSNLRRALEKCDWQDPVRRQFEDRVNELTQTLGKFDQGASELKPILDRKVRDLEQYLR
jgi:DNA repair ATPase RecN